MQGLQKSIEHIEEQIHKVISENKAIKNNYDLLLTVPGIGHLTAI